MLGAACGVDTAQIIRTVADLPPLRQLYHRAGEFVHLSNELLRKQCFTVLAAEDGKDRVVHRWLSPGLQLDFTHVSVRWQVPQVVFGQFTQDASVRLVVPCVLVASDCVHI